VSRRRGHGEDSIYKDGDRWRGAISLGYDAMGRRVRKKVSGRTRAEVAGQLRKLRQWVDQGTVPDDSLTVKAFLNRWLAVNLPGSVRESTEDDYNDTARLHLIPPLGQKRLGKLTVADVDQLWKAKREAGYSPNSVRIMRAVLRRALGQAEREGLVSRNVAALSAAPRIRSKQGRTLTIEQAQQLLDATRDHRFGVAVLVALTYGLRRGEVLGLHLSTLDWKARTVVVTHGVKRIKARDASSPYRTQLVIAELKTPRSRRTLTLTAELLAALRQHHARQAEARIAAGALWRDHGLIFTTEIGTPIDPESFAHTFSRLCKKAGLGHWHPHELRYSGASLMLAQGTPLHVVSEVLGHASITITKDVYGHLVEGDKRSAAESMSRALLGALVVPDGSQVGSQGSTQSLSAGEKGAVNWRARRDSNPQPSDP
jgi:integrase